MNRKRIIYVLLAVNVSLLAVCCALVLKRERRPGFTPVAYLSDTLPTYNDPFAGKETAPNKLVVFTNYTCEFCRKFYTETYPALDKDYIQPGRLKVIFKDFPSRMNRQGLLAAELGEYAWQKGRYTEALPVLYKTLVFDSMFVRILAGELGMDPDTVEKDLSTGAYSEAVTKDLLLGEKLYVKGTPTFVLNGHVVPGYTSREGFYKTIRPLLK